MINYFICYATTLPQVGAGFRAHNSPKTKKLAYKQML